MTVVKLGGSHAHSAMLSGMLGTIAQHAGFVVVVPGGGPFADTVRASQSLMGFDDRAAHDMALMAMGQYGRALACLGAGFRLAESLRGIQSMLAISLVPVWSPWPMMRDHEDVSPSWDVTSDSLAIWLAATMGARRVVLVKHVAISGDTSIETLAASRIVDLEAPRFARGFAGDIRTVDPAGLAHALAERAGRAAA